MSYLTPIQWADSTVNPGMGCIGCELFPPPGKVLGAIDQAVATFGVSIDSRTIYKKLISAVPLKNVAHVYLTEGRTSIAHEGGRPRQVIERQATRDWIWRAKTNKTTDCCCRKISSRRPRLTVLPTVLKWLKPM